MRNPDAQTAPPQAGTTAPTSLVWHRRSLADATSVLLELARALRGFASYPDSPVRRRALAERAFQALAADVARAGALELCVRGDTLAVPELPERLDARGGLAAVHRALVRHSIERLRFDARLTVDALAACLDQLLRAAGPTDDPKPFLRSLAARDARGITINGESAPTDVVPRALAATPPRPSVSVTTPVVAAPRPAPALPPAPAPLARTPESPVAPPPALVSLPVSTPVTTPAPAAAPIVSASAPAPVREDRGERLRARLVELDHTLDDATYAERASEIAAWVEELWQAGLREDAHHAMCVLADHAVGSGGRAESQARIAADRFAALATGERLEDLIDRALASDASGVRAAQLLLQRRETVVPALVDRIVRVEDPLAPSALHALVLTSGEAAVPTLLEGMKGRDETRARVCLRLAGELQSTALLAALVATAREASLGRQLEAIRALCLLPGEASRQALADALSSQLDQIAIAATQAIASNTGIDAVPALLEVLEGHVRGSRTQLCRALIEVLGRLGDERAVPRLAAILERKPVLRRAHWHALQLAAVDALSVLPSRAARRAVERAASFAAAPIRDRARARLSALAQPEPER